MAPIASFFSPSAGMAKPQSGARTRFPVASWREHATTGYTATNMRIKAKTAEPSPAKLELARRKLERRAAAACPPFPNDAASAAVQMTWAAWKKACPERPSRTKGLLYVFETDRATNVVSFLEKGKGRLICSHQLSQDAKKVGVAPIEVGVDPVTLRKEAEAALSRSVSRARTARTRGLKTA